VTPGRNLRQTPWFAILGTDLGKRHRETGQNRWEVAQPDGRVNSFELRI
jgi:hypothetical protein